MRNIKFSPAAEKDLLDIKTYITEELQNPIAAMNTVKKIVAAYRELQDFPDLGILLERYTKIESDLRFVLANNYSIFYDYDDDVIHIIRIIYSKRDFINIFSEKNRADI